MAQATVLGDVLMQSDAIQDFMDRQLQSRRTLSSQDDARITVTEEQSAVDRDIVSSARATAGKHTASEGDASAASSALDRGTEKTIEVVVDVRDREIDEGPTSKPPRRRSSGGSTRSVDIDGDDNDFASMASMLLEVVRFIVMRLIETFLVMGLILPILLPWRTISVAGSLLKVFFSTSSEGRAHFRKVAFCQILAALFDLMVLPLAIIALLIPTRTYAVVDLLLFQARYLEEPSADQLGGMIRYSMALRLGLLANFGAIFVDLIAVLAFIIAVAHVWRTAELCKGCLYILRQTPRRDVFEYRVGIENPFPGFDEVKKGAKSARLPRKGDVHVLKERLQNIRKSSAAEWFGRVYNQPWTGRLSESVSELRYWCRIHLWNCFFDWAAVVCFFLALPVLTRLKVLLVEIFAVLGDTAWPQHTYTIMGEEHHFQVGPWSDLRTLVFYNLLYAALDLVTLPPLLFVIGTIIHIVPLFLSLKRHWTNSPRFVYIFLGTNTDLIPGLSVWSVNGRYVRSGWFEEYPCFRRCSADDPDYFTILCYIEGCWQVCLAEDVAKACVRFNSLTKSRHSPVCVCPPDRWEVRDMRVSNPVWMSDPQLDLNNHVAAWSFGSFFQFLS